MGKPFYAPSANKAGEWETAAHHLNRAGPSAPTLPTNLAAGRREKFGVKPGKLPIRWATLPWRVCFVRRYQCADVAEAAIRLRETYIAAARSGYRFSPMERMFTQRMGRDPKDLDILCCIPLEEDSRSGWNFPKRR